jgi:hypothetical protein
MSSVDFKGERYAGFQDHVNVALVVVFLGLLVVAFLQGRYYMREGASLTETACVKAVGIEWKYGRRKYEIGHVIFQFKNGIITKANNYWMSIKPASGNLEKSRLEKEWLQISCFQIWFAKNNDADARIQQVKPPFMSLGGLGQWSLLAFAVLLAKRMYLKVKS